MCTLQSKFLRIHLRIDMKDKKLELWTTTPNCFLVATTKSDKVVGCISYKQLSSDTAEMHRLKVDSEFRRQKIGQKLVQALLNTAWSKGFYVMYLETSNANIEAINLYEKLNFKFLHYVTSARGSSIPRNILYFLSGLKRKAYLRQTNSLSNLKTISVEDSLSNYVTPLAMSAANMRINSDIEIQN